MDNAIRSYSWRLTAAVESLSPTGNACRLPYTACSNKQREMSWHLTFPNVSMKRNDYLGDMRGDQPLDAQVKYDRLSSSGEQAAQRIQHS